MSRYTGLKQPANQAAELGESVSLRARWHSSYRTIRDCIYTVIMFCAIFTLLTEIYLNSELHLRFGEYTNAISALIILTNIMICLVLSLTSTSASKT